MSIILTESSIIVFTTYYSQLWSAKYWHLMKWLIKSQWHCDTHYYQVQSHTYWYSWLYVHQWMFIIGTPGQGQGSAMHLIIPQLSVYKIHTKHNLSYLNPFHMTIYKQIDQLIWLRDHAVMKWAMGYWAYYSFRYLLFSKLCQHNLSRPIYSPIKLQRHW